MALRTEVAIILITLVIVICNAGMSDKGIARLKLDEGFETTVYTDTEGHLTVGWGHKLTDAEKLKYKKGDTLKQAECEAFFKDDLSSAETNAERLITNKAGGKVVWTGLSQTRKDVLINMVFNLGYTGLSKFQDMLAAIKDGKFDKAAEEMKDSKWYTQVTNRADRLIALMKSGTYEEVSKAVSVSSNVAAGGSTCGTFPNAQLEPSTVTSSAYNDPNSMGICLFDSNLYGDSQISDNFKLKEFKSKDGAQYLRLSPYLVQCLQATRDSLGTGLTINSGYRTPSHNVAVGGATRSMHQSGTAADVSKPSSVDILAFADELICECRELFKEQGNDIGLGLGVNYIHVDMRKNFGAWIYKGAKLTKSQWIKHISSKSDLCGSAANENVFGGIPLWAWISGCIAVVLVFITCLIGFVWWQVTQLKRIIQYTKVHTDIDNNIQ